MEMILTAVYLGFLGLAILLFSPLILLYMILEALLGETKAWKWFCPPPAPPPEPPKRRRSRCKTARQLEFNFGTRYKKSGTRSLTTGI
jgi:hypothetical protein